MAASIPREIVAPAFEQLVRRRRATPHFTAEEVPGDVIAQALQLAAEAPSGYNLQPWRYVIVHDPDARRRLKEAAFKQEKVGEAPLVFVACAERDAWQDRAEDIIRTRARQSGRPEGDVRGQKAAALKFIETLPREVWLNRHVMIGFTYLMLAFEALGWDTAPMEGFDAAAVRKVVGLPDDAAVVALLAVGRAAGAEPAHPGRLPPDEIAFLDRYGQPVAELLHAGIQP
ncbi:MAG TPA: nitroreductase family protein [Opitutaceae bacterium]|nr:nitroreductase family protein [Opitutaceae bacterium]